MGDYATKPASKQPAPAAAKAGPGKAPAPKVDPATTMPDGPAKFEADRLVEGLLQQARARGERALAVYSAERRSQVLLATEEITAFVRELVEVAADPEIHWDRHAEAFASLALLIEQLTYEVGQGGLALTAPLNAAYARLVFLVPSPLLGARPLREPATPLDSSAQLELARHAIGAARQHLATRPEFDPKTMRREAAAFCAPLKLHLAIASDAADTVTNRWVRRTLKPDVEALSVAMDELAESLAVKPELPWDVSFASAFDAENALRAEIGLPRRARPYTGNVDPMAAVQQVRGIANGDEVKDMRAERYADPATAVQAIHDGILVVFESQSRAVADLQSVLRIPEALPAHSWADVLLEIGANIALMAAAGAIGGAVSTLLKPRLEALQVGLSVPSRSLGLLTAEERGIVTSEILSRGVMARAMVGDALKDGSKEMFKSVMRHATAKHVSPMGLPALDEYARSQLQKLATARQLASVAVRHITGPLQQADLEVLNALAYSLTAEAPAIAYERQYDHSMREWQNFKARLAAGPAMVQLGRDTPRDADIRDEPTDGVIEISIAYDSSRAVTRRSMRLTGAEPAARAHFRKLAAPVGKLGLNRRFEVLVVAPGNDERIVFAVGPDRGVIAESLTSREWRLLKMLAERDVATLENVNRALRGEYDHTPARSARMVLEGWIRATSNYNTTSLED